jgi:diacylglycerol kinase (ATP)
LKTKVILNPYAHRWNALKQLHEAEASLKNAGITYDLEKTEKPGHGVELASQATRDGYECIIAAGGDSTINEVVNGILRSGNNGQDLPILGVLPMGTANDLADNLGIPKDLDQAAHVIASGKIRMLDVCQVNDRYFVNNSGVGLEPYITTIQSEIQRVQGIVRYLLATLIGIYRKPEWEAELIWDDGSYLGPVSLISVGNSPRTGGLFFLTPHADAFDGKLTFLFGGAPSRLGLLQLLPKAMRAGAGNVTEDSRTFESNTQSLSIKLNRPSPVHADGEIIYLDAKQLTYNIFPAKQPLLLPEK